VHDFFSKQTKVLGMRRMWDFITEDSVGFSLEEEKGEDGEQRLIQEVLTRLDEAVDDAVVDTIFMTSYIPRNLREVYDPERDVEMLKAGRGDELIYAGTTGLKEDLSERLDKSVRFEDDSDEVDEVAGDDDEAEDKRPRGHRHEDKEAKKVSLYDYPADRQERKKAVKEENREKRKTKMPKAEKQRLVKKSAH
jgi:RIO kinase 1